MILEYTYKCLEFKSNTTSKIYLFLFKAMQLRPRPQLLVVARRMIHRKTTTTVNSRFIPRRALMYVPGSDERKIAKIPSLKADCICLDCEDGVAFTAKNDARANIRKILSEKDGSFFGASECSVRVNSVQSGLCHLDVEGILSDPSKEFSLPSAIHLPKVDTTEILVLYLKEQ